MTHLNLHTHDFHLRTPDPDPPGESPRIPVKEPEDDPHTQPNAPVEDPNPREPTRQ
ncbi:MAG: hypothetical protein ABIP12_00260 [Terriglobales bacterium]